MKKFFGVVAGGAVLVVVGAMGHRAWYQKSRVEPIGVAAVETFKAAGMPAAAAAVTQHRPWSDAVRTEDADAAPALKEAWTPYEKDGDAWRKKWDDAEKWLEANDDAARASFAALAEDPSVLAFERAGRAKRCELMGGVIPVADDLVSAPLPPLVQIREVGAAVIAKGLAHEAAGRTAEADKAFGTVLSVARHLTEDRSVISTISGHTIEIDALRKIGPVYEARKDAASARIAADALAATTTRRKAIVESVETIYAMTLCEAGMAQVVALLDSPDVPPGLRAEAALALSLGYLRTFAGVVYGPEGRRREALETAKASSDPVIAKIAASGERYLDIGFGERKKLFPLLQALN